ncbi:hypothetical protein NL108_005396 [Boleophthalmus pectinirostris]|uniref:mucin-5AC-like n=1 Tax=Boleophthalmus pectinirostris TaxID=150288 RepID=UPI0024315B4D|nr:mucin-5AC-like [Boleophthalmus pectinirostris]KAJ0055553.1 hypothetical protein NL108_005396 [Boleophthalmus pectinirostris]
MNFNLASIVLLVALCWMSVGIYAQSTTTTMNTTSTTMAPGNTTMAMAGNTTSTNSTTMAPTSNTTTTAASNMTSATTAASNMTSATTAASNMTSATTAASNMTSATTAASNMTSTTTAASNMTSTTTAASNMTTQNATTAATNATAGNNTSAPTTTTTAAPTTTTTAPPIEPNTTVTELSTNITRDQCQKEKLCAAQPDSCDPEVAGSCYFVGVKQSSGQNMDFELSGETDGYLGCTLKPTAGDETAYLCVKTKNKLIFIGAKLVNGKFTNQTVLVNKVRAVMNGKKIQCSFSATVPNATARSADTTFEVSVVTGTYNETTGQPSAPTTQLRTAPVDLTNPKADTNNTLTNSTAAPATTTAGTVPLPSVSTALLIVLGVLSLAWL